MYNAGGKMKFRRAIRYYLLRLLRLRGTPWKVALGFALGACVNFFPTFGIGVLVAGLLASAFRVSIAGALLGDLMFKSFFPIFFYFNLITGYFLTGQPHRYVLATLRRLLILSHLRIVELERFGSVFFLGAVVNTAVLGGILTALVYLIFSRYRPYLARYVYRLKKNKE